MRAEQSRVKALSHSVVDSSRHVTSFIFLSAQHNERGKFCNFTAPWFRFQKPSKTHTHTYVHKCISICIYIYIVYLSSVC